MKNSRRQRRWDVTNDVAPSVYFGLDRKLCGIYTLDFDLSIICLMQLWGS